MKKTLLAATTLSALMASGMANAAFTDADGSGGWTGNLEFNGTITSISPAWKYQIPEATIAGAKNWDVERASGTVDGSNTNFNFAKNMTVLEGVMKAPAPKGSAGMQPVITFGEAGKTVVWDTADASLATPKSITVSAKKGSDTVGSLSFNLVGQAAAQGLDGDGQTAPEVTLDLVPDAKTLLLSQSYYKSTYAGISSWLGGPAAPGTGWAGTGTLPQKNATKLSAALVAKATEFKLSVPTVSIPDAWSATLPISITVK